VLDTYEAAMELLEKRSAIYSSRTRLPMINELMGWEFDTAFAPYGMSLATVLLGVGVLIKYGFAGDQWYACINGG
jgi:hypothetical protein